MPANLDALKALLSGVTGEDVSVYAGLRTNAAVISLLAQEVPGRLGGSPSPSSTAFKITSATGDGSTNDTATLQGEIDTLASAGGGVLALKAGKVYKITSTLSWASGYVQIWGHGATILASGNFGDIIHVEPSSLTTIEGIRGLVLRDFRVISSTTRTSGAVINAVHTHDALLFNLNIGLLENSTAGAQPIYDGIIMDGQSQMAILGCKVFFRRRGISVRGTPVQDPNSIHTLFGYDGWIGGNSVFWGPIDKPAGSSAIYLYGGIGGLRISDTSLALAEHGIYVTGANSQLFIEAGVFADSFGGCGFLNAGSLNHLVIANGWWAGNGCTAGASPRGGISVGNVLKAVLNGNLIHTNNIAAAGASGIITSAGDIIISNNNLHNQTTDIVIGSGVGSAVVSGNILGSATPLSNSSTGTVRLQGNVGIDDDNATGGSPGAGNSLNDSLLAAWNFEEASGNRLDQTANDHDLVPTGGVTQGTGHLGNCITLNGSTGYLSKVTFHPTAGPITIAGWFKFTSTGASIYNFIIGKWKTQQQFIIFENNGIVAGYIKNGAGDYKSVGNPASPAITANAWHFVAFRYDGSGIIDIRIDDSSWIADATAGAMINSTDDIMVGTDGNASGFFAGSIDAIQVWTRKLTNGEVDTIYNSGVGLEAPFV